MDGIRQMLDELMGKDRDLSIKEKYGQKKHFSDEEVCKFYLLDFCPHDLFPNTKSDLGKCMRRHDQFFKMQYLKDLNREKSQRKFEQELMDLLESLIAEVDNKMKKSLERIEAPLPDSEKPKDVVDQIRIIDANIQEMVEQAEKMGEIGRIEESEKIMRQIDRLKDQKGELITMTEHPLIIKEKQMKVCEICGAMQSLQDNEKRLQTHLEGKLHTGYAKIREHLDILRRRKLEWKRKIDEDREKERIQKEMKEKEKIREKERDRKKKRSSRSHSRSVSKEISRGLRDLEKREIRNNNPKGQYIEKYDSSRHDRFDYNDRNDKYNINNHSMQNKEKKERKRERSREKSREKERSKSRSRSARKEKKHKKSRRYSKD